MKDGLPARLNFGGNSYDLAHLAPFVHRLAGLGIEGADLRVRIVFKSHVFSLDADGQPHHFLDESSRKRVFCPTRYGLSQNLSSSCVDMLLKNTLTWEERDKNGYVNLAVLSPADIPLVSGTHAIVIYYLTPSFVPGIDVELIIITSYKKQINFDNRRKREKILKFIKMAYYKKCRVPKN